MFMRRAVTTFMFATACSHSDNATTPPDAAPALSLAPCSDEPGAECGTLEVWEDRAQQSGRKIPVFVKVYRATGPSPAPDPVFVFAGGPGQSVSSIPGQAFAELRQHRDIVLVDQRGTGQSHPLTCTSWVKTSTQDMLKPYLDSADVVACRDALSQNADLRHYTTANFIDDVDDVRRALGYDKINVYGSSYGTRPVQVYLRRYPKHARTGILHGVIDNLYPLGSTFAGQVALDGIFAACTADPACHGVWGDPAVHLAAILPRFSAGPLQLDYNGESVSLSRDVMMEGIRHVMYSAAGGVTVPRMLERAAAHNDYSYLIDAIVQFEGFVAEGNGWHSGLWLSVSCSEDAPWITDADLQRADAETVFGRYRGQRHVDACRLWPQGELPEGFRDPVVSDVPSLVLSGAYDPATSVARGNAVAQHLSRSRHVVAKDAHGFTDPQCADRVVNAFLQAGTADGLDTSCLEQVTLPAWPTKSPPLEAAVVTRLVGEYTLAAGQTAPPGLDHMRLVASVQRDALRMQTDGPSIRLSTLAPDRFELDGIGAQLAVAYAANGDVEALSIEQGGMQLRYTPAPIERKREILLPPTGPNFSPAVRVGDTVFLSGNVGLDPATGELVPGGVGPETKQALSRIEATLRSIGLDLGDVAKCTVYLANMKDYDAMNEVYRTVWPAEPPARTTVQAAPPIKARVEIECIAAAR